MTAHNCRQTGFSLVEMMIALAAGMVVVAAVLAFTFSSMKSNGEFVQSTRLSQELRNTMDMIVRDVGRAGYNDAALDFVSLPNTSPFAPVYIKDVTPFVTAGDATTYANADIDGCIIYAYDRTYPNGGLAETGSVGVIDLDNGEVRGVRRIVNGNGIGVIEYAESSDGVTPACDGDTADYTSIPSVCNAGSGWCALSDPSQVDVTKFRIIDKSSDLTNTMRIRDLNVVIEGRITNNSEFTRSVTSDIKIRSDCVATTVADCKVSP
jgi:Tfp pilus assembly protein PilW